MTMDETLCGYRLGRFVPSRNAFMAIDNCERLDSGVSSPVLVKVWPRDDAVPASVLPLTQDLTGERDASSPTVLIDVGRTRSGDLVVIERFVSELAVRNLAVAEATNSKMDSPQIFERPAVKLSIEEQSPPGSMREPVGRVFSSEMTGVDRIVKRLVALLRHRAGASASAKLRSITRPRARVILVFFLVLALATVVAVLAVGSGPPSEGAESTSRDSLPMDGVNSVLGVSSEPTTQSPIEFAVQEAKAGRVPVLVESVQAGGNVEGRIVSQTGDIILVELSVSDGVTGTSSPSHEMTIATLLLQKEEKGWRLRDIFNAAN